MYCIERHINAEPLSSKEKTRILIVEIYNISAKIIKACLEEEGHEDVTIVTSEHGDLIETLSAQQNHHYDIMFVNTGLLKGLCKYAFKKLKYRPDGRFPTKSIIGVNYCAHDFIDSLFENEGIALANILDVPIMRNPLFKKSLAIAIEDACHEERD